MELNLNLMALQDTLKKSLKSKTFYLAVLSSPMQNEGIQKISIRPIETKAGILYQMSEQRDEKIFHHNVNAKDLSSLLFDQKAENFKQAIFFTEDADYQLLRRQNGTQTILKKKPTKKKTLTLHNRQKNHLLPEGEPIDFLIRLGIMNKEGQVFPKKMDKFRQINRYLEIVEDTLSELPSKNTLNILDFGCGKSYLTFALYYYLKEIKNISAHLTGLDLKKDVIDFCNDLSKELGYDKLDFEIGDIEGFIPPSTPDMVICLHACDTATDAALENAVRWQTQVILAVPCCQHELFNQIEQPFLSSLLRHGILRERFAALATDAARADILEALGYNCQIMEFIDMEHTPKNLLIKAVRSKEANLSLVINDLDSKKVKAAKERYSNFAQTLKINPSLEMRFR